MLLSFFFFFLFFIYLIWVNKDVLKRLRQCRFNLSYELLFLSNICFLNSRNFLFLYTVECSDTTMEGPDGQYYVVLDVAHLDVQGGDVDQVVLRDQQILPDAAVVGLHTNTIAF